MPMNPSASTSIVSHNGRGTSSTSDDSLAGLESADASLITATRENTGLEHVETSGKEPQVGRVTEKVLFPSKILHRQWYSRHRGTLPHSRG